MKYIYGFYTRDKEQLAFVCWRLSGFNHSITQLCFGFDILGLEFLFCCVTYFRVLNFPARFRSPSRSEMPLRDGQGRFCGTLQRKETDGHWSRSYFVLDEEKCLLRYFSYMKAEVRENVLYFVCVCSRLRKLLFASSLVNAIITLIL